MDHRLQKQARDRARASKWDKILDALPDVVPWLAVRWLFAQTYNGHKTCWPCQRHTRERAREVASLLIEAMGGNITAPPPPSLQHDAGWALFLAEVMKAEHDLQHAVLLKVIAVHIEANVEDPIEARDLRFLVTRLRRLLIDIQVQRTANEHGWVPGKGFIVRKKKKKKRKR